jgi:hypothetical protein
MALGTYTDMYIDLPAFHSGIVEGVAQNLALFNALSRNTIIMRDSRMPGHYNNESFFGSMEDFAKRRDITSTSGMNSSDISKIVELTERGVKLNRKIPINQQLDSFKKSMQTRFNGDIAAFSSTFGAELAVAQLKDQLNTSLLSVVTALRGQAASLYTVPASGKLQKESLNYGRAKLGDAAGAIRVWVMHSTPYFDLVGDQVADNIFEVTGAVLYGGTPATYGIPTLVTDSSSLVVSSGGSSPTYTYYTLGLVEGAVQCINSESESAIAIPYGENENLEIHFRAEYAYNNQVKGFAWDVTNGSVNPSASALGTTTNWDPYDTGPSAHKRRAGVVVAST